jgi:hypothetical protein
MALLSFSLHKYYVSIMEIHPNITENKLQIILRTFPDDMENTIKDHFKLTSATMDFEDLVKKYVKEKIRFAINGKETNYSIIAIGTKDEYLIILIEVPLPKGQAVKYIHIQNEFFLDEFDEQKNIIHYLDKGIKRSYIMNKKKKLLKITF